LCAAGLDHRNTLAIDRRQQQSIVSKTGVIHRFGIDQEDTDDVAKLQQRMPLPIRARQPRRLDAEDGTDLLIAHRRQKTFKAGATDSGSRDHQIVVDDVDILPPQGACTIDKAILASLAFQIVPHLLWR
jgi:hypothetical protein